MKQFFKHISIYGILPVIGKFAGFFLVPIYARVFSSHNFGIIEMIVTLINFIMLLCNMELYTAVGRRFYEKETTIQKKELISTGLFLTTIFTIIIIIIASLTRKIIINHYLNNGHYQNEYNIALLWLFFQSIYTYLGVIPRYDKKPKLYVLVTVISLLVRVCSTIIYVLIFKVGIVGVLYGHLTGSIIALILNMIISSKYLGLSFNKQDAYELLKYSTPMVPGLFLVGLWAPLSRDLIAKYFSIATVGLFSFAIRITSVIDIFNNAIRLAWNPLLFENYKNASFKEDFLKISKVTSLISFTFATIISLLSPEICKYIGTTEYEESAVLIGFLAFKGILEVLRRLRGFGPLILKKTHLITINEIIGLLIGLFMFTILKNKLGLAGIGIAFILPSLIKYILLVNYTSKSFNIRIHSWIDLGFLLLLTLSICMTLFSMVQYVRFITVFVVITFCIYCLLKEIDKSYSFRRTPDYSPIS